MCGIAGIFLLTDKYNQFSKGKLEVMLDRLEHRGPDNRGQEIIPCGEDKSLHLGHQRLSIIDLSPRAHQPMANEDQSVWVSTNSEIYNFRELRQELENKYRFFSSSDTEVLLRAYEEWGIECLDRLHGMFAFAIWDSKKCTLFLARDRLGIKPLYFYSASDAFVFASEVRAIQASGIPDTSLNPLGIYDFLSYGRLGASDSILNGIQVLEPAHYLLIKPATGEVEEKQYWQPFSTGKTCASDNIEGQISHHLQEAVRLRMVSDVPLGAFLSGGIDSSAVASLMTEFPGEAVKTLSVIFEEKQFDESEYSSLVAKALGTEHHVIPLQESDFLAALPHAIAAMDQPTVDGINTYIISRAARDLGLKVVLSGLGGDELFAGYDSFKMLPRLTSLEKRLQLFPRSMRVMLAHGVKFLLATSDKNTKLTHLVSGKINGCHLYYLFRALFCLDQIRQLIEDPSIVEQGLQNALDSSTTVMETLKSLAPVEQISYLETTHYMANMLLRDTDMMSMANALEVRVPLIDHKLVEFMFTVPGRLKIDSHGANKPLLVNSLPRKLPQRVVHRKKMGFTLPFDTWMRTKLKQELENVLLTPLSPLNGIISESAVQQVWRDFLRNRISWSRPWSLFILKKWVERNIN